MASVSDSGLENAVRSTSSYHGRRRVKARRVDSVRREMYARRALVVVDGGSESGIFWEDILGIG